MSSLEDARWEAECAAKAAAADLRKMNRQFDESSAFNQFMLGERYSSEDMYRDYPDLRPGDRVAVEIGGVLYTDTIKAASPVVYPTLTAWQRLVRRLTPAGWRKPLQPIRRDPLQRAQALTAKALAAVEQLTAPPAKSWWRRWVEGKKP